MAVALLLGTAVLPVRAGNTWDGGGANSNWTTGNNWNPDGTATSGTTATVAFGGSTRLTPNNDYGSWTDWQQVQFNSGASSFAISGNPINLWWKIENNSANLQTWNCDIAALGTGLELNPLSGDLTIGAANIYNNGINVIAYSGNQGAGNGKVLTISGNLQQGGKLQIRQDARVKITGKSTYTGNTEIDRGEFWLGSGGAVSSSSAFYVGNGGQVSDTAKLWLQTDGLALSNPLNVNNGNANTRVIGGLNSSGTVTYSGTLALSGPVNLEANQAGGTVAFTGVISGSGFGITKTGPGTVSLTGANTYSGGTTISAGNLQIIGSGTLGSASGAVTASGGTLDLGGTSQTVGAVTIAGGTITDGTLTGSSYAAQSGIVRVVVAGSGAALTKTTSGTLTLGGYANNTCNGLTMVSGGTLSLGMMTVGVNAFGGDLTINAGGTVNYLTGAAYDNEIPDTSNVTLNTGGTLDFGARNETIGQASPPAGSFTMNGGSLLKAGTGTLQFSRNPKITAGTITHSAASTVIQFNQELIFDGGTIDFSSPNTGSTAAVNLRGGDGTGITYESSGTATASITYSGAASGGTGARLSLNTAPSSTTVFTIADAPAVDPELDITVAITGSYALLKSGAGTMRLSGGSANTYNGLTTVNGGILALNKTAGVNAIPAALTISSGMVRLDAANQIADSSALTVSGGTLNLQANNDTVSTVTLTDGSITGSGGTLTVTGGPFDVRKGSVSAKFGGSMGLTKTTADTVTLSGANTYSGSTTISGGALLVNGSFGSGAVTVQNTATLGGTGIIGGAITVQSGGTLAPGASIGTLTVNNSLMLNSGSTTAVEVNRDATPKADKVTGISTLTQGGALSIVNNGAALQINDSFTLFSATTYSGEFATISPASPNNDTELAWDKPALKSSGLLQVHHVPYATNQTIVRAKGMSAKLKLSDLFPSTDPLDSDTVVLESFTGGSHGATITSNATYIFYLPANDNNDSFDYTVKDSRGERRTRTITIYLTNSVGSVTITNSGGGQMTLSFVGIPGYDYVVQRSSNLVDWVFLVTNTAPTSGLDIGRIQYTETPPYNPAYYRIWRP
jgi:autotransporter-associated beta strand protein